MMPTKAQSRRAAASQGGLTLAAAPHLTYYGGPVVSNAHVYSVLWGASGTYLHEVTGSVSPNMDTFFGHITNSSYLSWLREYNTTGGTNQAIGYGSFSGRKTITPSAAASGTTLQDSTIQSEVLSQINKGHLPAPSVDASGRPNTIYALFFPEGTKVCENGSCSGSEICAYHGAFAATISGHARNIRYMVLPHPDATIVSGCGSATANTASKVLESYTSHELVETITDPDVSLATASAPPLGWYDRANGEIADICVGVAGTDGTVTGTDDVSYVVQKEWSNALGQCIVDKGSTTPSAPSTPSAHPGASGTINVAWSAPSTDGGTGVTGYHVYESSEPGAQGPLVVTLPATATHWTSDPLATGTTSYFEVAATNVNGAGPPTGQVSAVADATVPVLAVTQPSSLFQLSMTLTSAYHASDIGTGVAGYDVQYRKAKWTGGFGPYVALASNTALTTRTLTGRPGYEYCFRERAHDVAGNASAWSPDRCAAIPLDDRAFTTATAGWRRLTSPAAYHRTLTTTATKGAELRIRAALADRLGLVVTTCSSCGKVAIYLNGRLWRIANTAAPTRRNQVIVLPGRFSLRTTTIVLKNISKAKRILIDGLALART